MLAALRVILGASLESWFFWESLPLKGCCEFLLYSPCPAKGTATAPGRGEARALRFSYTDGELERASHARNHIEGDGETGLRTPDRIRAMPHIRREQHQPAGARLHEVLRVDSGDRQARLTKLEPAGLRPRILDFRWH